MKAIDTTPSVGPGIIVVVVEVLVVVVEVLVVMVVGVLVVVVGVGHQDSIVVVGHQPWGAPKAERVPIASDASSPLTPGPDAVSTIAIIAAAIALAAVRPPATRQVSSAVVGGARMLRP